jgi:hypothetical protein
LIWRGGGVGESGRDGGGEGDREGWVGISEKLFKLWISPLSTISLLHRCTLKATQIETFNLTCHLFRAASEERTFGSFIHDIIYDIQLPA